MSKKNTQMVLARQRAPASARKYNANNPPTSYARETSEKGGPKFSSRDGGDLRVRVRHREYVCDVDGASTFSAATFNINPGLVTLFPWLSQIAANFESYQFHSLAFEWCTQAGTANTGKGILSVDYDAADPAPESKQEALQQRTKADGPVWMNFAAVCDRKDLEKFGPQKYVRTGGVVGDIKTYDLGLLNVIVDNSNVTAAVAEIYVSYDVELMTPSFNDWIRQFSCTIAGGGTFAGSLLGTVPVCDGAPVTSLTSSIPNLPSTMQDNISFAQVGEYLVDVLMDGTGITDLVASAAVGGPGIGSLALTLLSKTVNAAATAIAGLWKVDVTQPGQSITFAPAATTVTASGVRLAAFDYDLD